MKHIISLVLGDWSSDGHGKTDTVNIKSNLDKNELFKSYKKGSKKVGFNFIDEVCSDYEDGLLSKNYLNLLVKQGFTVDSLGNDISISNLIEVTEAFEADSEGLDLDTETYTRIFLFITKLGNEKFQYEILKQKDSPTIEIGGYGLFS